MRIASVSDLHTDYPENRDAVVKLAIAIHEGGADVLIVAGDVSHKNDRIRRALAALKEAAPIVAYIPGNHDLWFDVPYAPAREDLDTWQRYRHELRQVATDAGAHYLPAGPLYVEDVAIVGTCGWYDYSLMPEALREGVGLEALESKQYGGVMWSDARFIAFRDADKNLMPDVDVARQMERELLAHVAQAEEKEGVEHIVAVTHHQPFDRVVTHTGQMPWEFFCAFMGSEGLGRVIASSDKIRHAIYGHTHIVGDHDVDGVRVFGTALGYPRERKGLSEDEVVASRVGWIDL